MSPLNWEKKYRTKRNKQPYEFKCGVHYPTQVSELVYLKDLFRRTDSRESLTGGTSVPVNFAFHSGLNIERHSSPADF